MDIQQLCECNAARDNTCDVDKECSLKVIIS